MSRSKSMFLAAALATLTLPVSAQTSASDATCVFVPDDARRLACYDAAAGRYSAPPELATAPEAGAAAAATPPQSMLTQRTAETKAPGLKAQWFSLTAHRTNYVLPVTYVRKPNWDRYAQFGDIDKLKDYEAKYQLSLKTPLWPEFGDSGISLWMAFTIQSWWQAFAKDASAPFRETNYEPEIYATKGIAFTVLGVHFREVAFGLNHQSNGRTEPLSRSWNRATARIIYDSGNFAGYFKTWARFSENAEGDNNPNIERYLGQAEMGLAYRWNQHTIGGILKNNLRSGNKSGVQLDWTFPLLPHLKGYVQGYTGYGESMIDGDRKVDRVGMGLMLADWF